MSDSKFCINCGKSIPKEATFCPFCGTVQEKKETGEQPTSSNSAAKVSTSQQLNQTNMWTALKLGFKQTFTWSQRMSRSQYWWLYLDLAIISLIVNIALGASVYEYPAIELAPFHMEIGKVLLLIIYTAAMSLIATMQFTATVRRLHDTNRSAHYLWLALIPIIGTILIIVFLCQRSQADGIRFDKTPVSLKPWPKKWWTWCVLVAVLLIYAVSLDWITYEATYGSYRSESVTPNSTNSDNEDDSDSDDTDTDEISDDASQSDTDSITIDDDSIDVTDQQAYESSFSDSSWANSTFKINEITVYKTDGTYTNGSGSDKEEFNGIVKVHMSIHAGQDISAYPTQAELSTNDGQQVDADLDSDDFDGDLNSGTNSDGNVYFLLPQLDNVSDLTSIRVKWDASYETDDYDDDNDFKTFDATINLN
ncbi:hypothetical protein DA798_10435 [Lactobacillus sp. PFC-70]|nr:hypothetical protein DA798_10435 [Lactobacillus sp. PFC-70]